MKLLLDENLSRRLVAFLLEAFPASTQVALLGLERASDAEIWQIAKTNDFVIVTKDADFYEMSALWTTTEDCMAENRQPIQGGNYKYLVK